MPEFNLYFRKNQTDGKLSIAQASAKLDGATIRIDVEANGDAHVMWEGESDTVKRALDFLHNLPGMNFPGAP